MIYSNVPRKRKGKEKRPFALYRASVMLEFQIFFTLSKVSHSQKRTQHDFSDEHDELNVKLDYCNAHISAQTEITLYGTIST